MNPPAERWLDRDAGPLVRPYAMTRGRTRPGGEDFPPAAAVAATGTPPGDRLRFRPEHLRVLRGCARPVPVAALAAALGLPLGVVRVLLGDLRDEGLVAVVPPVAPVAPAVPVVPVVSAVPAVSAMPVVSAVPAGPAGSAGAAGPAAVPARPGAAVLREVLSGLRAL